MSVANNERLATTWQDVCLALAQEEENEAQKGGPVVHTKSMLSFLTVGLDLEEQQYATFTYIHFSSSKFIIAILGALSSDTSMESERSLLQKTRPTSWRSKRLSFVVSRPGVKSNTHTLHVLRICSRPVLSHRRPFRNHQPHHLYLPKISLSGFHR